MSEEWRCEKIEFLITYFGPRSRKSCLISKILNLELLNPFNIILEFIWDSEYHAVWTYFLINFFQNWKEFCWFLFVIKIKLEFDFGQNTCFRVKIISKITNPSNLMFYLTTKLETVMHMNFGRKSETLECILRLIPKLSQNFVQRLPHKVLQSLIYNIIHEQLLKSTRVALQKNLKQLILNYVLV